VEGKKPGDARPPEKKKEGIWIEAWGDQCHEKGGYRTLREKKIGTLDPTSCKEKCGGAVMREMCNLIRSKRRGRREEGCTR